MAGTTKGVTEANGKCYIRYYVNGRRQGRALNIPYTAAGIRKAARIRAQIIENAKLGIIDRGPCPTFGELAQKWLDTKEGVHRTKEKGRLNNYWLRFYPIPIDQIRYDDLLGINVEGLKPKTRKNIYTTGSGVFELARKSEWISTNPAQILSSETSLDKQKVDPFTREERDELLGELTGKPLLYYTIRFYCGLRPSEVIALQWRDYDRKAQTFHIRRSTVEGHEKERTKTGKERYVHVHTQVQKLLKKHPRTVGKQHMFLTQYGDPYPRAERLATPLVAAMDKLGIRYRDPYNARHTCATMMLEAEMAPAFCAKALGHSLQMFFEVYADYIDKALGQQQVEKWEAGL